MKSIFKKTLCSIMLFCLLFLCVGVVTKVSAVESTTTITYKDFNTKSYEANNGDHTIDGVTYYSNQVMQQGSAMQFQKSKGYIYNKTAFNKIVSINVEVTSGTFTLYLSEDSSNPTSGDNYTISSSNKVVTLDNDSNYKYFNLKVGSSTGKVLSITITYEASAAPSIFIELNDDVKIGHTYSLVKTFKNFVEEPTTINWTTTDESKVSISNDGQLKGIAMGSAKIYAEVVDGENTIKSNEINVKVWPDNSITISHDMARSICEFTGSDATPFNYIIEGYVISISKNNVYLGEIKDATTTFLTYNLNNYSQLKVGDYIAATGKLKTYNSTPEMDNGGTYEKFYNVVFNVDGAEYKNLEKVINGSTIKAPEEPKKVGYTFVGWFNGDNMWDFENDTVTTSLTLEAKFVNSVHDNVQSALNLLNPYLSLGYTITLQKGNKEVVEDVITVDDTAATSTNYVEGESTNKSATYVFQNAKSDANEIQLRSKNSNSGIVSTISNGLVKKIVVEFGSSSAKGLDIYGNNDPYITPADLYNTAGNTNQGEKIGTLTTENNTLEITNDYKYIGFRSNSGALYIKSITITWETETTTYDSNFKLRVGIDDSIATVFDSITKDSSKTYEYGIQVSSSSVEGFNEKVKQYALTEESTKDENIYYLIIDLEDLMNNPERLNIEFTVQAYAKIGDEILLSTNSKTYSVASLIEYYYSNDATKDLVKDAYDLLKSVGAIK